MFVLEAIKAYAKTNRIALQSPEGSLSFAELDAYSESFAAWLLERFPQDRTPVVVYGHKENDLLPCLFGALKSGRGYVPVDTTIPPGRAAEVVADIAPKVIVDFLGAGFETTGAVVLGSEALKAILHTPAKAEVPRGTWVSGGEIAYILFTSGSTGRPKGVPITAANLQSFYRGLLPYMEEDGGVILNQISYSFDVSCCSIYAGLSRGMTLLTVDKQMVENMNALFEWLRQSGLTMWVSTPSFAEICVQSKAFSAELMPHLRKVLFCGEVLTNRLCNQLVERFPHARILNTYGPTEATVLVTAAWVTEEMRRDACPIPIGSPIRGTELRLVDAQGLPVEKDEACGELLIVGDSVGPGYHQRPDLTEARFFRDEQTGKRGYRTGDIACRKNGLYYFQGRADNQLKINGHRVEMEDIENNLARVENIARAAVIPVWDKDRVQYLAAFILLEKDDGLTPLKRAIALKKQAAAFLPAYMIPRRLVVVDAFPLNANGKVDKKELANKLREAEKT